MLIEREVVKAAVDAHGVPGAERFVRGVFWRIRLDHKPTLAPCPSLLAR